MADDGMLLNFSVSENPTTDTRKFKGGSWRDRLHAKRSARGRQGFGKGAQEYYALQKAYNESSQREHNDFQDPRPTKRLRQDELVEQDAHSLNYTASDNDRRKSDSNVRHNVTKSGEVISSLFPYNYTSTTVDTPAEQENEVSQPDPSNAPLKDGIDTFTSLGLNPKIATHVLTKMDLKDPTAIQKATLLHMLKEDGDTFIQSETGSGKTLAYLLPLVQHIMNISTHEDPQQNHIMQRSSGLFAIILAPTRELCKQILVVLERLLGCAHYIVAGTVIGGEKKKSEKARLRKGLNILVATPGRLVDHLDNTKVLDVSNVRWLVLDEGDRLMELGFEEDITKIVNTLDQRMQQSSILGFPAKRTTVLCSATLKLNVQKLGEVSLKDAVLIKGETDSVDDGDLNGSTNSNSAFLAPAQLQQSYLVVPPKQRLVGLTALLKHTFGRKGSVMKAIVFVSCADSVEFHFRAFTRSKEVFNEEEQYDLVESSDEEDPAPQQPSTDVASSIDTARMLSSTDNSITLHKLHGSLPQPTRTAIVKSFSTATTPSLLIATDVASRGLDLPNLDLVIEYDPAFSSDDHLHRIGRTARLGRDGRAIIFLLPGKEEGYVEVLRKSYKKSDSGASTRNVKQIDCDETLRKGFSKNQGIVVTGRKDWMAKAMDYQLEFERWALSSVENKASAKRAFQSHVRAYATHIVAERKWFDIKELHLGHLAKAFGLRDAPSRMNVVGTRNKNDRNKRVGGGPMHPDRRAMMNGNAEGGKASEQDEAARKMRGKIRDQKKRMMLTGGGADEFNIA